MLILGFSRIVNSTVAKTAKIYGFVNIYGAKIGENTKIGAFVEIQEGVQIGNNCKISSHSFLCSGVKIENEVFIGHAVMFINDKYARATNLDGTIKTPSDWDCEKILVKRRASIGSNCTILGNLSIGENAIVGAGSVVTKDVPPNKIVVGNPARVMGDVPDPVEVSK